MVSHTSTCQLLNTFHGVMLSVTNARDLVSQLNEGNVNYDFVSPETELCMRPVNTLEGRKGY